MVLFDDRDPPWMNKEIKKLIYEKKNIFNCFHRNNNKQLLDRQKDLQTQLNFLIEKSKRKYYSWITSYLSYLLLLSDIGKSSKTYWSILKNLFIGQKKFMFSIAFWKQWRYSKFQEKKNKLFNSFFCKPVLLN